MRATINQVTYDTEKAIMLATYNNDLPLNDFDELSFSLYCTPRSRRLFVAGRGGARTVFSTRDEQGGEMSGEGIIALPQWRGPEIEADWIAACQTGDIVRRLEDVLIADAISERSCLRVW